MARFVYESRLFFPSYGQMRFSTNPSNAQFQQWASDYLVRLLNQNPLAGGLFMDNSMGKAPTSSGTIESTATYSQDYANLLTNIDQAIAPRWIIANTSGGYQGSELPIIAAGIPYYEEFMLRPLSDNYKRFLDNTSKIATREQTNPTEYGVLDSSPAGGSPTDSRTELATLAYYYLLANPTYNFLDFYGGYEPGTTWTRHWTDAVKYNVGSPENTWSTFATGTDPSNSLATYNVYQRNYSNALVLYKPLSFQDWNTTASTDASTATTHQLDGMYYPLQADGTLAASISSITLRNGEGAILIPVPPPPTPPVANDDAYATSTGTALAVPAEGVLANDTDVNHDVLTAILASGPSNGTLTLNADGSFNYAPQVGFHGTVQFSYEAFDGTFLSNTATVTIVVDDPPTGNPDSYTTTNAQILNIAAPGVLANHSDSDNDPITAQFLTTEPSHGTLAPNSDGFFTYSANAGYVGADQFTYQVFDGLRASAPVTVTLTITDAQLQTVVSESFDTSSTLPQGWQQWSSTGTNSFSVSSARAFSPSNGLVTDGSSATEARLWYNQVAGPDGRVSDIYLSSLTPVVLMARGSGLDSSTPTYYGARITCGLQLELIRVQNGQTTSLGVISSSGYFSSSWVRVTLNVVGLAIQAEVERLDTGQYLNSTGALAESRSMGNHGNGHGNHAGRILRSRADGHVCRSGLSG